MKRKKKNTIEEGRRKRLEQMNKQPPSTLVFKNKKIKRVDLKKKKSKTRTPYYV